MTVLKVVDPAQLDEAQISKLELDSFGWLEAKRLEEAGQNRPHVVEFMMQKVVNPASAVKLEAPKKSKAKE